MRPTFNTQTLEQRVAQVILQHADTRIEIDGVTYDVTPATPATLMLISGLVSEFPFINDKGKPYFEVLRTAKDMQQLGRIAAAFILGAKRIRENRTVRFLSRYERRWSWRRLRKVNVPVYETSTEFERVADVILQEVTIETLTAVITQRLNDMQIGSFFALTTSLSAVNVLKPTKEVETPLGESLSDGQQPSA